MKLKSVVALFVLNCIGLSAQPLISYIMPDIGAPGMTVQIDLIGPNTGDKNGNIFSTTDTLFLNNANDAIRLECVRASDRSKITFSPAVVSWNGRLLSTIAFISPTCAPNSSDWRLLSDAWRIPVQVINPGGPSNIDTFYIVAPTHLGNVKSVAESVLGTGSLGIRSRRGAMLVDSLILKDATYTVSLNDPDGVASNGNQAYLPFVLLAQGRISGSGPSSKINLDATGRDGGPGGGGGGGQFCDYSTPTSVNGSGGGNGYTGGGRGGRNGTGLSSSVYNSYGRGSGPNGSSGSGNSLNDTEGSSVAAGFESAGGGTGHPFGKSGSACTDGVNCIPSGGFGGGSGARNLISGAGAGNSTDGASTFSDNAGKIHGNLMNVPLAGGSGAAGGNPQGFNVCAGWGGGGGGALQLTANSIDLLQLSANGASGATAGVSAEKGGSGSGGCINVQGRQGILSVSLSARGGGIGNSSGAGGEGRTRVDGVVSVSSTPSVAYVGPTIDTLTIVKPPFTLRGTGAPGSTIFLHSKTESSNWQLEKVITVDGGGRWTYVVNYLGADQFLYYSAAQRVENAIQTPYGRSPSFVLSSIGAVVAKVLKIAQVSCDAARNIGKVSCAENGTKLDTFYVRNLGNINVTLDSGTFATGTQGFSIESPLPLKNVVIKANDSIKIVVRFRTPPNVYGTIRDRLIFSFPTGTFPQLLTTDYSATVDTVGLAMVDVASGTEFRNGFAINFDHVCASVGITQTFGLRNISKGPVNITSCALQGVNGVFNVTLPKRTIALADSVHFVVKVPPRSKGIYYDTLLISIDSCDIHYRIPMRVRIVETLVIGYPTSLEDFTVVKVGKSLTHKFVIRNEGSAGDSADFRKVPTVTPPFFTTMVAPDTIPRVLAPGDSIVFLLEFKPDSSKYYTQTLEWIVEQAGSSCPAKVVFNPHGIGTNSSVVPNKSVIDFGNVFHCTKARDTIWIRNAGIGPAKVYAPASIVGPDQQRYKIISQPKADSTDINTSNDSLMYVIEFNGDPTDQTTSIKSATLNIRVFDDSAHVVQVTISAKQIRAKLLLLDALPIVVNNIRVNTTQSPQLGVRNETDTAFCINGVRSLHPNEVDASPAFGSLAARRDAAFQFTITPKTLADITDTVTIYFSCPCVDSLKVPIIIHPTNNSLVFTPSIIDFDTVKPCARPAAIGVSMRNVDATSAALVDTVYLAGTDTNIFQLSTIWTGYPYVASANSTINSAISVAYNGSGTLGGLKTAYVVIRYRINNQNLSDTILVRAYRVVPIRVDSASVEFGSIKQGQVKVIPLAISNDYAQQLDITFSFGMSSKGAFNPNPTQLPIPGGLRDTVRIEFGKDSTAEYRDTMYVKYFQRNLGCTDSIPLPLHGEILPGLNFELFVDKSLVVNPTAKNVKIGLWAKIDTAKTTMRNLTFTATIEVPGDMFFPTSVEAKGGARYLSLSPPSNGNRRELVFSVDTLLNDISETPAIIANLVGEAMLGAQECDSIKIIRFDWTNSGLRPTTWVNKGRGDGEFCTAICKANGSRLVGGALTGLMVLVSPNPADHSANVSLRSVEKGMYVLSMVNQTGQEVLSKSIEVVANSAYNFSLNVVDFPTGVYTLRCFTPTRFITQPLLIIR